MRTFFPVKVSAKTSQNIRVLLLNFEPLDKNKLKYFSFPEIRVESAINIVMIP